jgi:hypothetical protein
MKRGYFSSDMHIKRYDKLSLMILVFVSYDDDF